MGLSIDISTQDGVAPITADKVVGATPAAAATVSGPGTSLSNATPQPVAAGGAAGSQNAAARADHVHDHGSHSDPTDHAVATGAAHGFMPATDKAKLDASTAAATAGTLMQRDGSGAALIADAADGDNDGTIANTKFVQRAITLHVGESDPHTQYTTDAEATAIAADAVADHEAAVDPHPQYLTEPEADALYEPIGSTITDHGALTGLGDDDHTQYHTDARGDARYPPLARTISAGTGLSGGGDLSANRTLNLANTAVTPGSYTSADITVDAQGRITAAANGTPGGSFLPLAGGTMSGAIVPNANGTLDFGASATNWRVIYAQAISDGADQLLGSSSTTVRHGFGSSWTAHQFAIAGSAIGYLNADGFGVANVPANTYGSGSVWAAKFVTTGSQFNVHGLGSTAYEFVHRGTGGFLWYATSAIQNMTLNASGLGLFQAPAARLQVRLLNETGGGSNQGVSLVGAAATRQLNLGINDTTGSPWVQGWIPGTGPAPVVLNPSGGTVTAGGAAGSAALNARGSGALFGAYTSTARGGGNNYFTFQDPSGEAGFMGYGASNSNLYFWNNLAANILIGINGVTAATIDQNGRFVFSVRSNYDTSSSAGSFYTYSVAGTAFGYLGHAVGVLGSGSGWAARSEQELTLASAAGLYHLLLSAAGDLSWRGTEVGWMGWPLSGENAGTITRANSRGKAIAMAGGCTLNTGWSPGDRVLFLNFTGSNQTLTQGGSATLYYLPAMGALATGNRTLAHGCSCEVVCIGTNTFTVRYSSGIT